MKFPVTVIFGATILIAAEIHSVQQGGLTIHEWGTFTSVAGEDGSAIEWNTLGCKSDLPRFVIDRGDRNVKWSFLATVRMETPVLYFYSSRELDAHVRVAFPRGLITSGTLRPTTKSIRQVRVTLKAAATRKPERNRHIAADSYRRHRVEKYQGPTGDRSVLPSRVPESLLRSAGGGCRSACSRRPA